MMDTLLMNAMNYFILRIATVNKSSRSKAFVQFVEDI